MRKKILITGSGGFIGRNLSAELTRFPERYELLTADIDVTPGQLTEYLKTCDFVVHLAGVNRPKDEKDFQFGNADFTQIVTDTLQEFGGKVPVAITSSTQAALDNPYGQSKLAAEKAVLAYGEATGAQVYVFRLPNVFGKWCRPNYNSAVATFCHNIARGLPITVNDPQHDMTLVYIDDVLDLLKGAIEGEITPGADGYSAVPVTYGVKLGAIADKLHAFHALRGDKIMPSLADPLDKALYATYLSYLEPDAFTYALTTHADERGLFAEFFKTRGLGQFSFSVTKPGVKRGSHWHHTKVEKFLVVSGRALIRFRVVDGSDIIEYEVSAGDPVVVDTPPGYTHSIDNLSDTDDLVTLIWASELFDPDHPDTYPMEV